MFIAVSSVDLENVYTISIINPITIDSFANININSIVYKLDINHIKHDIELIHLLIEDEFNNYTISNPYSHSDLSTTIKHYKINLSDIILSLNDILDFLIRTPNDYSNYDKEEKEYQKFKKAFEMTTFEILDPPGYIIDNKNKSYIYFMTFQDLKNFYYRSEEEKYVTRWSKDKHRKIKKLFELS